MIHVDIEQAYTDDGTWCAKVILFRFFADGHLPWCEGFGFYALKDGKWRDQVDPR
jgi:hypothetical protein